MATMTTRQAVEASAKPVLELGRAWMMAPSTADRAAELGLAEAGRFAFWVNGRAGVLGDVDHHIAAAAIGFMAPDAVSQYWRARPDSLSAWHCALAWFDCASLWGRSALAAVPDGRLGRLSDLVRRVIDHADPSLGALFAGSMLVPRPGDPAGDAIVNLNVLRELRGGAHLAACHAAGLGPHATIMSTDDPVRGGAPWAETFGWPAPHPAPEPDARALAEEMTTAAMLRSFEALDERERSELVDLVLEARAAIE